MAAMDAELYKDSNEIFDGFARVGDKEKMQKKAVEEMLKEVWSPDLSGP